ncbi:hypothetical protein CEK71_14580 [Methylovulum psychrotolerans]|uniref:Uncharacterized protein n=1 Tax=Methylovulum psychrotolerans TaxID=1704499 RepID=A0A1Z4C0Y6_9GAMM|nr:hypothetical protein [Methylovulum psychrotolerans]ASF47195.1 hypothetical protein CEK71_14580 [Methylovulum psychrotolerans]
MIIGYCKNDHLEWKTNGLSSGIQKKTAFSDERTGPDHPGSRFKLECLKIKHKTNHFAMRAKLFVKANQMAYEELQKLRAA